MAAQHPAPKRLRSVRVQPKDRTILPTKTNLSIVDATVATFGAATALWAFKRHDESNSLSEVETLIGSLAQTLTFYPHFAGQLNLTPWPLEGAGAVRHTDRFRRCFVTYGLEEDPGVEFQVAQLSLTASELFPAPAARRSSELIWDQTDLSHYEHFSPDGTFPANSLASHGNVSGLLIRVTVLACGTIVVVPRFVHPLADAETMISFMKAWGNVHKAMSREQPIPDVQCVFDPSLLDSKASGDIDVQSPDPALIEQSMKLPLPRYDWWEQEAGKPANRDNPQVYIPQDIPESVVSSRIRGQRIPWEEWDITAPVTHKAFHLTSDELRTLHEQAVARQGSTRSRISLHDVLLAFVWQLIAAAKPVLIEGPAEQARNDTLVSLDTTIGLRPRLGLPSSFVGSPILIAGLSAPYSQVVGSAADFCTRPDAQTSVSAGSIPDLDALAVTASVIRLHLSQFNRDAIGAWLHEQAFEIAPQRWWNGFLGSKHLMATSWIRAGIWEVDFGDGSSSSTEKTTRASSGSSLLWAGVIGPKLDGLATLVEAEGGHGKEWYNGGVDIDLKLESKAMSRVVGLFQRWRLGGEAPVQR